MSIEETESYGRLPSDLLELLESKTTPDKAISIKTMYQAIEDLVDSEFYRLEFSMADLDNILANSLYNKDTLDGDVVIDIHGAFLRTGVHVCKLIGIELEDLEELSLDVVSEILRISVLLSELELGLEEQVLKICDSLENEDAVLLDFCGLLSSYSTRQQMEFYENIRRIRPDYFKNLRETLEDKVLEPDESECMDLLQFYRDVSFKYNISESYQISTSGGMVNKQPILSEIDKRYIDGLVENKLCLASLDRIAPFTASYINTRNSSNVELILVLAIASSKEGQLVNGVDDRLVKGYTDLIAQFDLLESYRDIVRESLKSDTNQTAEPIAGNQLERKVEQIVNEKISEIALILKQIRRM